ncbi:hypothetical protein BTO14_15050 [Polaribacter butkevichii]|uniref:Uncharacterized protein n=1 Tax=Polaribacter butkevichii TaxID=218490 RepID=A0A2P6C8T4_9FLAO|nr:hypothetical protein BTO14_15050 [Polaribacter butkevichii]
MAIEMLTGTIIDMPIILTETITTEEEIQVIVHIEETVLLTQEIEVQQVEEVVQQLIVEEVQLQANNLQVHLEGEAAPLHQVEALQPQEEALILLEEVPTLQEVPEIALLQEEIALV